MRGRGLKLVIAILIAGIFLPHATANAAISSCSDAEVTPHTVAPNSSTEFSVRVRNTDDDTIVWVEIIRPSGNFTISGAVFNGWEINITDDRILLTGSGVSPGENLTGTLTVDTTNTQAPLTNWVIKVSDSLVGIGAFFCGGSLGVSIDGEVSDEFPPELSNLQLSNLTSSTITISWESNELATTKLLYGLTEDYGQEKGDNQLKTKHTVTITGLSADAVYFFQPTGTDAMGNTGYGEQSTFLTPLTPTAAQSIVVLNQTQTSVTLTPDKEKVPPTIIFTTTVSDTYQSPPLISGLANDNDVLAKVEYSTDGGTNWQAIDAVSGISGKRATFSFTPRISEDGNYNIVARAIDAALNVGLSETIVLVIDTGPPVVGVALINAGPTIIAPGSDGVLTLPVGVTTKVTLAAGGGPIELSLVANSNKRKTGQVFSLTRSTQTGLWLGAINFAESGIYQLRINSLDGAGNHLDRILYTVRVLPAGKVVNRKTGQALEGALVTAYIFDPASSDWKVWDATAFGQHNPQTTAGDGEFKLLVPSGKYYVEVRKSGYQRVLSTIVTTDRPTPLGAEIGLKQGIKIGNIALSWPWPKMGNSVLVQDQSSDEVSNLIGEQLPDFTLDIVTGQTLRTVDLLGRPTVITVLNTWLSQATEQLSAVEEVGANQNVNVFEYMPLESAAKIRSFLTVGDYEVNVLSDKTGSIVAALGVTSAPQHFFISRQGVVKNIVTGLLTADEIKELLEGL